MRIYFQLVLNYRKQTPFTHTLQLYILHVAHFSASPSSHADVTRLPRLIIAWTIFCSSTSTSELFQWPPLNVETNTRERGKEEGWVRDKLISGHSGGTARDSTALQRRRSYWAGFLQTGGRDGMDLPAVGEHVFAVEGIEKKRLRKVKLPQTRTTVNGAEDAFVVPVLSVPNAFSSFFRAESSIWWSGEDGQPSKCLFNWFICVIFSKCWAMSVLNVLYPTSVALGIPSQILREWICICTVCSLRKYAHIFICLHYL